MKLFIITVVFVALLTRSASAQSTDTHPSRAQAAESEQNKKDQKTKAKAQKEASKPPNADKGKKTTSTQDAAYAAAYKAGIPK
jgi:hypothetical protein